MLSIISDIPIIPMTAPMTNNSIITSIAPTKNSNTEIRLTSPFIKKPRKRIKSASIAIIPAKLIRFEYNWYKKPKKMIHVNISDINGLVTNWDRLLNKLLVVKMELIIVCIAMK